MAYGLRSLLVYITGYTIASVVYFHGFLLIRPSLPNVTTPETSPSRIDGKINRLVIIVIDALRYDYAKWQDNQTQPYHNRMTWMKQKLTFEPENAILGIFVSDPPTTTMQRIKGLTTGSLPTFIDAGANFASSEIDEDSWILQAAKMKERGKMVLLGDDTWISLFPTHFDRVHAFPSFDTYDLHTVDDGILEHIYEELEKSDQSILIAHFLGVDHAGHFVGPYNAKFYEKLAQMDKVLWNISKFLNYDDLLLVFGDHGMTPSGDHGGDSKNELNAAIFAYSKRGLPGFLEADYRMPQIDLVPTVSALLGQPIPFSNLGVVQRAFFRSDNDYKSALTKNRDQIVRYAKAYMDATPVSGGFRENIERRLRQLQKETTNLTEIRDDLVYVSQHFREVWSTFNEPVMTLGCFLYLAVISALFSTITEHTMGKIFQKLAGFSKILEIPKVELICAIILCVISFSTTSNSYIIHEDMMLRFALATILTVSVFASHLDMVKKTKNWKWQPTGPFALPYIFQETLFFGLAIFCVRVGSLWNRCREEQRYCDQASFFAKPANFLNSDLRLFRIILAASSIIAVAAPLYTWLRRSGNTVRETVLCLVVVPYGIGLMVVCAVFHWVVNLLPDGALLQDELAVKFGPSILALLLFVGCFCMWFADPLMSFVTSQKEMAAGRLAGGERSERLLRPMFRSKKPAAQKTDIAVLYSYGLSVCFSSPFVTFLVILVIFFALILGDGSAVSIFPAFFVAFFVLEHAHNEVLAVFSWFILSQHFFYAFGHHANLAYIPWDPAFLFFPPEFRSITLQAILISLNVFASYFLFAVAIPLLVIFIAKKRLLVMDKYSKSSEFGILQEKIDIFGTSVKYCLLFLLFCCVRVFGSVFASAIHRRHLMAWKIFAPKYLFDVCSVFAAVLGMLFGLGVTWRLEHCLCAMMSKIEKYWFGVFLFELDSVVYITGAG